MGLVARVVGTLVERLFDSPRGAPVASVRSTNQSAWGLPTVKPRQQARHLRVTRIVDETRDTRSLWLECDDTLAWQAGQFLTCCVTIDGQEQRRAYSIASLPGDTELRLTVKRLDGGLVSTFLHRELAAGDRLKVLGPSGDFILPQAVVSSAPAVFIAGGVGITPIYPLLMDVLQRAPAARVLLLYASHSASQIIFRDELQVLTERYPNLTVSHVISRAGTRWLGLKGRLDAERLHTLLQPVLATATFFVCGPQGLMDLASDYLQQQGVEASRIHRERFLAAATARQPRPTAPQSINFTRSARQVVAQPGQTVLGAALAAGVALDYSCQVGGCGHCRIRVTEGEVAMDEPNCLTDEERAQGYRLACLSYACAALQVDA
jgi:ring-1,2-phenylacetyl-CoA epoxidase subunit PaaE